VSEIYCTTQKECTEEGEEERGMYMENKPKYRTVKHTSIQGSSFDSPVVSLVPV
jgi:hypothetical protein